MPRSHPPEIRRKFAAALERTGDYREACQAVGIPERTGRRWRSEGLVRASAAAARAAGLSGREPPGPSTTSFEGRSADLAALSDFFERGERVVTVFGPPGIGKTRLTSEFLKRARPGRFRPGRPVFCDLRAVRTREATVLEFGRALGLERVGEGPSSVESLGAALAARGRVLAVIDNAESASVAVGSLVAELLQGAPESGFLITSRRLLGLRAEVPYELSSLLLPVWPESDFECLHPHALTRSPSPPDADPWDSAAMRLFRARALAAEPALRSSDLPADDVCRIVHRLEGVPLAIELAASQLRRLGVRQLSDELQGCTLSVEDSSPDVDPRHRSLRRVVEQSYRHLSPVEQRVFAQLSIFHGGFTEEAAHAVLEPSQATSSWAGPVLRRLRESSMLRVERSSGVRRWGLSEPMREFAEEKLRESGLWGELATRHADYFERRGEQWVSQLRGHEGESARLGLKTELANFRLALNTREHVRDPASMLRLTLVLFEATIEWAPTHAASLIGDGIERAQNASRDLCPERMVPLLLRRSAARRETRDLSGAMADLDEARALANRASDGWTADQRRRLDAEIELHRGLACFYQGAYADARAHLEKSLSRLKPVSGLDVSHLEGQVRCALGTVRVQGSHDEAGLSLLARGVGMLEETGDVRAELWARYWWAGMQYHFRCALPPEDLDRLAERCRGLELRLHEVHFRYLTAIVRFDFGQTERARDGMREVRDLCRRTGLVRLRLCGAFVLGSSLEVCDALDEAIACYEDAVAGFESFGDRRNGALAKVFLAGATSRHGDVERSRRLLQVANRELAASGDVRASELVELQRGRISVAQIRQSVGTSGVATAATMLGQAEDSAKRAARLREVGALVCPPLLASSAEARMIAELLQRDIESVATDQRRLVVRRDGAAFARGGEPLRLMPEGELLRRLLLILVERRLDRPGQAVETSELIDRCWPGERMRPQAGRMRVRGVIR